MTIALAIPFAPDANAAQKSTGPSVAAVSIEEGKVLVAYTDGTTARPPVLEAQVDASEAAVADDRQTVGWLIHFENSTTSYSIPLTLVIFRSGRVLRQIGIGFVIGNWRFEKGGTQVSFYTNTLHGDFAPYYELRDLETDRIVDTWEGHLSPKAPEWAQRLAR